MTESASSFEYDCTIKLKSVNPTIMLTIHMMAEPIKALEVGQFMMET